MPFQKGHKGFRSPESYKKAAIKIKNNPNSAKTRFKKGEVSAFKGRKHSEEAKQKMSATWFKSEDTIGEANNKWKGDDVGYEALHGWLRRHKGQPERCEFCKAADNLHWANISKEYKRDVDDFFALCASCHKHYDNEELSMVIKKYGYYRSSGKIYGEKD